MFKKILFVIVFLVGLLYCFYSLLSFFIGDLMTFFFMFIPGGSILYLWFMNKKNSEIIEYFKNNSKHYS